MHKNAALSLKDMFTALAIWLMLESILDENTACLLMHGMIKNCIALDCKRTSIIFY